jgi:hypothetical protein
MADSNQAALLLMQLVAQKGALLAIFLTVGLGLLIVLFGRRYKAGWQSHTQRIVIGLLAVAISQLALLLTLQRMMRAAAPKTQAEYDHIVGIRDKLFNADNAVRVAVLVWWIVCLWIDEPGTSDQAAELPAEEA